MPVSPDRPPAEPLPRRLVRGAVGGVLAGIPFVLVTMWFASSTGGAAEMPLRMMSTIVLGDGAMAEGSSSPAVGALVHVVLSALFGIGLALAAPRLPDNGTVAVVGAAYGVLLYLVNFHVLAPTLFTTFEAANKPFELFAHVVFGSMVAFTFFGSGVRRTDRVGASARQVAGR
jgi:hypothetical protein